MIWLFGGGIDLHVLNQQDLDSLFFPSPRDMRYVNTVFLTQYFNNFSFENKCESCHTQLICEKLDS